MPKQILLIDDEPAICRFTKLNLERTGEYVVTIASSGEEGLEKAGTTQFDLIITDYRMPGLDGRAVLEKLKATRPDCPVVLFSIYHDDNSRISREIERKADGLISKPIDHEQLYRTIREALEKRSGKSQEKEGGTDGQNLRRGG